MGGGSAVRLRLLAKESLKVSDAVSESPNVLQPSAPYERLRPVVAPVMENHPKIQLFFSSNRQCNLMDFCHLTSFVHDDSAIYYYRICITSLYILTPDCYLQRFKESSNFRRGFYTVLCGRGNGGRAWKVNLIHPDAYEIGFIWSPTA